jgi:hypothetical protein
MRAQGWCRDPYGIHGERWYSDGEPTSLVRDGGVESRDAPPPGEPSAPPVPLNPTPTDASDMMRADQSTREDQSFDVKAGARAVLDGSGQLGVGFS